MTSNKLFITCPIFYVNARPHLGHVYTLCLADAWARYAQLRGNPALTPFVPPGSSKSFKTFKKEKLNSVFLTSGTDEHGTKVAQAAKLCRKSPQTYVDEISPLFKLICQYHSVELTDFVRTTDDRHKVAVEAFWSGLQESGYLYQSTYSGWYSVIDEAFYTDWEISTPTQRTSGQGRSVIDQHKTRVARETGSPVEWLEESTYMFRLSAFKQQLHGWLDSGVFLEHSEAQRTWKLKAHELVETAQDVSVSRSRSRLDWGIPVPGNSQQVMYVWLDALVNYLTVAGFPWPKNKSSARIWPPDFQFIGKDILRFHAVLWPALLLAVGLELPRHLICHSHLLSDGIKMSKSKNNVADPFDEQLALSPVSPEQLAVPSSDSEGLRYVLLRSALLSDDASYSRSLARQIINSELVNSIGNLLARVTSTKLNPNQAIVRIDRVEAGALFGQKNDDAELLERLDNLASRFDDHWWVQAEPHLAIEQVLQVIRLTNAMIDRHKPWEKNTAVESEHVIAFAAESLRLAGWLLSPVVPKLASRLLRRLGLHQSEKEVSDDRSPHENLFWSLGPDRGPFLSRLS